MIYALISIAIASGGQAILKGSLNNLELKSLSFDFTFVTKVLTDWHILLGLGCYGFSAVLWLYALSNCNLSRIYPLTGLSFILVILISRFILGEAITTSQSVGIALIIIGLFVGGINY